jgi:hypothetical protein
MNKLFDLPTLPALDQTERARNTIRLWLRLGLDDVDPYLARLIAACVHSGEGSALYALAATGAIDADRVRQELNGLEPADEEQEDWADALCRYALLATHPERVT